MVQDLGAKYDILSKTVAEKQVANTALPEKFKILNIPIFMGSEDPMEHLMTFPSHTSLHKTLDVVACRAFPLNLSGKTRDWLKNLLPRDSLWRFNQEKLDTESALDDFIYSAIFQGLKKDGPLMSELALKPPKDSHAFMIKVDRYINQEETLQAFLGPQESQPELSSSGKPSKKKKSEAVQDNDPSDYKKVRKNFGDHKWIPLDATLTEVMRAIEKDPAFQRPKPLPGVPLARLANKYCAFHNCNGHLTEQCISLRQLIEKFVENSKLVRFLVNERNQQDRAWASRPIEEEEGGIGGTMHRDGKKCERGQGSPLLGLGQKRDVKEAGVEPERMTTSPSSIPSQEDLKEEKSLVRLGWLMPDNWTTLKYTQCRSLLKAEGSSADILFKSVFDHMSIPRGRVALVICHLLGFAGEKVLPLGSIELPVTAGTYLRQKVVMVKFLVLDKPSAYNAIFGRTALNELKAITSTPHLSMNFPIAKGIEVVKGDQREARRC
ncbi:uncharacterized protein LOC133873396 [Alnus glutinosa]|uniref:uncharacterized protein LOC133873396 n=1 Tax=Alnus glutinosa TaxID=3517 RepID=UPI002D79097E|nr:uncharacterized protein LOC133873396 [Alnus glutinosa]